MESMESGIESMESSQVHDDVELMLNCSGPEILELIASDPKYYFNIVTNYKKTRDGRDIYLPDLFNILITRNNSEYRIKFKTCDNGNWYEVGYSGGEFTEEEVHIAFAKKVQYAINRSADSHRSAILDTLLPGGSKSVPLPLPVPEAAVATEPSAVAMKSQGDQTKLSKIDRYMSRSEPVSGAAACAASAVQLPLPAATIKPEVQIKYEKRPSAPASPAPAPAMSSVSSELDILRTVCPDERKADYERLVKLLRSSDVFYQTLVNLLPRLSGGQRILVTDFLLQN
jgi:hypothetical protein